MRFKIDIVCRDTPHPPKDPEYIKGKDVIENIMKLQMLLSKNRYKNKMRCIYLSPIMNLWLQWRQTWNLNIIRLGEEIIGKYLILQETSKAYISHPLEASLEKEDIGYNDCGY